MEATRRERETDEAGAAFLLVFYYCVTAGCYRAPWRWGRGGEDRVWEREGAGGHWWAGDIVGCAVPPVVGFLLRSRLRHEIAGARAAATATGKDRFK
jgi:hypothetical protein